MSLRHIAFLVAYEGGAWSGSQRQANAPTVQGELERALQRVLKHPAKVALAGRTDAGVHASGQVGLFSTENSSLPTERVPLALNAVMARTVRIRCAWEVDGGFHPRFSASSRIYRYRFQIGGIENPLLSRIAAPLAEDFDLEAMRQTAQAFLGRQDFAAWQSAGSPTPTTVREVRRLTIEETEAFGSRLIEVEIEADAFLYQMVRNIVGALVLAGKGQISAADVRRLTAVGDRTQCPPPAPPQGLCLVEVKYDSREQEQHELGSCTEVPYGQGISRPPQ